MTSLCIRFCTWFELILVDVGWQEKHIESLSEKTLDIKKLLETDLKIW